MPDVVCMGQTCVDILVKGFIKNELAKEGEMRPADEIKLEIGGDATNESRILTRMGYDVKIVSGRGDDAAGMFIENMFARDGVDLSRSVVVKGKPSGAALILLPRDSVRSFIVSKSMHRFDSFEITPEMVKDAKIVTFASLFFEPFIDPGRVYRGMKLAKEAGAKVCADVNFNDDIKLEDYKDAFALIDYFFPNDGEAFALSGKNTPEEAAEVFLSMGVKNVIIKMGAKGGYFKGEEDCFYFPAFVVENPIDTTGAGDNFAAGFISGLLDGKSVRESCRFGCATSSIAVQSIGASTGVKSKQHVVDTLAMYEAQGK